MLTADRPQAGMNTFIPGSVLAYPQQQQKINPLKKSHIVTGVFPTAGFEPPFLWCENFVEQTPPFLPPLQNHPGRRVFLPSSTPEVARPALIYAADILKARKKVRVHAKSAKHCKRRAFIISNGLKHCNALKLCCERAPFR
jgi:hypothetical protein